MQTSNLEAAATEPLRPVLGLKKRLLFSAFIGFLLLLFAELALKVARPEILPGPRASEGGILQPFYPELSAELVTPEFLVHYQSNSAGFRDAERSPTSPLPRALCLGDSFTEGWGVEAAERFTNLAEAESAAEFLNMGFRGGNALWFIVQAREFSKRFKAERIIVQIFDNDLEDCGIYRSRFLFEESRLVDLRDRVEPPGSTRRFLQNLAIYRGLTRLRRLLKGRAKAHDEPFYLPGWRSPARPEQDPPATPVGWSRHSFLSFYANPAAAPWPELLALESAALRQLIHESRAAGLAVTLLYIPAVEVFLNFPDLSQRRGQNPHYQSLRSLCDEESISLIDATELFSSEREPHKLYFPRDQHLRPKGHAILGAALAKELKGLKK